MVGRIVCAALAASLLLVVPVSAAEPPATTTQTVGPAELFSGFPEVRFGMSFADAESALRKAGLHPFSLGSAKTELAWNGAFEKMSGRGTVALKTSTGVYEVAVLVTALDRQQAVFDGWLKRLTALHGVPSSTASTSVDLSDLWRLKGGMVVELRMIKDPDSPVVEVHWVR